MANLKGGTTIGGYKAWHSGNDGAGSNLDADKLGGVELADIQSEIDSDIATHTSDANAHHSESHTVASHSDTTVTGAELNADHTKLIGIEAGAKDDQTATEIVTLINASAELIDDNNIAATIARDSEVTSAISTHASDANAHHTELHTVASHSDTTVTGAELNADHTKLIGIETAATADQTAAEILTAIKTVDGTGSGLDADKLDGIEGANVALKSADADIDMNNYLIKEVKTVAFNGEVDNGNSSTADTIDWNAGQKQKSTLTGNCTYTFTALTSGIGNLTLKVIQDATGSRTVTWPSNAKWTGGTAPTLSTAANAIDIVSFYYDGTSYYGMAGIGFA